MGHGQKHEVELFGSCSGNTDPSVAPVLGLTPYEHLYAQGIVGQLISNG